MKEKFIKVLEKFKAETAKECYKVEIVDGDVSVLDNKIGGVPYLPVGCLYPKDSSGNEMSLLLQVNLKDIDLKDYPKDGILEVFVDKDLDYPCQYAIKYFSDDLEYQKDVLGVQSAVLSDLSYKIDLIKAIDYMPYNDYRFGNIITKLVNEEFNVNILFGDFDDYFTEFNWFDLFFEYMPNNSITIGGYADFTQYDPRSYSLNGMDDCLFKLDSNYDFNKVMIGDSGILFTLNNDDIKSKNFSEALVDWDCC